MWELVLDFLRDPISQSVCELVAILVTVLLFIVDRKRKELSFFSVWTYGELADSGEPWFKTRRFVVVLANTGKVPIVPSDYEGPITFFAGEPCQIIDAAIIETHPHNIHPKMILDKGTLVLSSLLLNPGDSIRFEASATGVRWRSFIHADGRIAGVSTIRRIWNPFLLLVGPFVAALGLTLALFGIFETSVLSTELRRFLVFLGVVLTASALYGPWLTRIKKAYSKEWRKALWRNEIRLSALQDRKGRRRKP